MLSRLFRMFRKPKSIMIHSHIAEGTIVEGTVRFGAGLQIDGKILGDLVAEIPDAPLVIGPTAEIRGAVKAGMILCEGRIFGPVESSSLVSVRSTGQIIGDVSYGTIHIEEGGRILGNLLAATPVAPDAPAESEPAAQGA